MCVCFCVHTGFILFTCTGTSVARCRKVQGNILPVVFSERLHSSIEYGYVYTVQLAQVN